MEAWINIIGLCAGLIFSTSLLPQIIKIIKRKEARSISAATYMMQLVGLTLWFVYGWAHDVLMFLIWQAIAIAQVSLVLFLKYIYRRNSL